MPKKFNALASAVLALGLFSGHALADASTSLFANLPSVDPSGLIDESVDVATPVHSGEGDRVSKAAAQSPTDCATMPHTTVLPDGQPSWLTNSYPAGWAKGYSNQTKGRNKNLAWPDKSVWGTVPGLVKGHKYTFIFAAVKTGNHTGTVSSLNPGWHPGATIWARTGQNTAGPDVIASSFYSQNTYVGPVTCSGGQGVLAQYFVKNGYSSNGMQSPLPDPVYANFNGTGKTPHLPPRDNSNFYGGPQGLPGVLILTFTAQRDADYEFMASGFNPDPGADLMGDMGVAVIDQGP